jgi:FAD/FMN-containing dehydrogenase
MRRREFLLRAAGAAAFVASRGLDAPARAAPPAAARNDDLDVELAILGKRLRGRVVLPGEPDYERLRRVVDARKDLRPRAIVRCRSADDVRRAVELARERDLVLAVRSGGHSVAGHSVCEGGLVLDLSGLDEVVVDAGRRVARVSGGALSGAVEAAAAPLGLAPVLGECPSVGVGGFALGGGESPLMGLFGLGCDNVHRAQVVLADSRILTVSADERADLYWALRGGGGNFGVVTSFELALHALPKVLGGTLVFSAGRPAELLASYRDFCRSAPDELTLIGRFLPGRGGAPSFVVRACWCGDPERGAKALSPLRTHRDLVSDGLRAGSFASFQSEISPDATPISGAVRSGFLPELDDEAIAVLVAALARHPASYWVVLAHLHGAVSRLPAGANAWPFRSDGFDCWITADWETPEERGNAEAWVLATWRRLAPKTRGAYVNGLDDEGAARVVEAYGGSYRLLAQVKRRYDPQNFFRMNQNVKPA